MRRFLEKPVEIKSKKVPLNCDNSCLWGKRNGFFLCLHQTFSSFHTWIAVSIFGCIFWPRNVLTVNRLRSEENWRLWDSNPSVSYPNLNRRSSLTNSLYLLTLESQKEIAITSEWFSFWRFRWFSFLYSKLKLKLKLKSLERLTPNISEVGLQAWEYISSEISVK